MQLLAVVLLCWQFALAQELTLETPAGGKFALASTEGLITSDQLIGKNVLLFFGFSRCPDVCPLTLRRMKQLAGKLSASERANFRFLFVSVDTERDSIDTLVRLKKTYGPEFIGATGSDAELAVLARSYGARFRRYRTKKGQLIVDHTDSVFHIDQQGKWVNTFAHTMPVDDMLAKLREDSSKKIVAIHPARRAKLLAIARGCDLTEKPCSAKVDGEEFTLELSPRPISVEKDFSITLTTKSKKLVPLELDFEGVHLNMGYLRPTITPDAQGTYRQTFRLPICELPSMQWRVRLIVRTLTGAWGHIDYQLTTVE